MEKTKKPTVDAVGDSNVSDQDREQRARNEFLAYADPAIGAVLVDIHHRARDAVRANSDAKV